MKMRKVITLFAMVGLALVATSCKEKVGGGEEPKKQIVTLDVAPSTMELAVGKTEQIVAIVSPKDIPVSFVSSNDKIASVSDKGIVTAVAVGSCTITIKAADVTQETKVTVKEAEKIDDSRFIGLKGNEMAPCIFIPKQNEMVNSLAILKEANALFKWVYKEQSVADEEKNGFLFEAPSIGKQQADKRLIYHIQYQTALKNKSHIPFIACSTRIQDKKDPFSDFGHKSAMETLAKAYGFNEGMKYSKLKDGNPCLIAYNNSLGADEPLEVKFYTDKKGDVYEVAMQIAYRGPQN